MVDMKNESKIVIWENCDPLTSEAIKQFEQRWQPYSVSSRRYPIIRLIEEVIDPSVTAYMAALPASYSGYIPGAGTGVAFSAIIRLVGLEAMVRVQRQLLRQFIKTEDRQTPRDQRFVATLESLIGLVWDCACKRPKKSAPTNGVNLNSQRKHGFCDFCGNLTEFASFMATVADEQINDSELEEHRKFELSHQFCAEHRPKLANGEWNPAYRQAKRSHMRFKLELARLNHQCAKRSTPQAASGDPLVDSYFYHYMLAQTVQPADKAELRNQARLMADSKLSDRKKQMLVLQHSGFNQSEIARRLGIGRQAVSKALASIHEAFHLKQ
ncbi:TPA: LuxR family transcriptional regulator [Salmonella enterica]|uniref:LuxR family transcriptional regulator n=1 Tax=Salmonella enterica TaxID=28901 RepID=A0A743PDB8_SALER|nr:LuxR family transcriptional regulator [Salmonella enterica]